MKKIILLVIFFVSQFTILFAQTDTVISITKKSYRIPMRDGVRLFTIALYPANYTKQVPILIERTRMGADLPIQKTLH